METIKICGIDPSTASCGKTIMLLDKTDYSIVDLKYYCYSDTKVRCYHDYIMDIECVGSKYKTLSIMERQHIAYPVVDKDMEDVDVISLEGYAFSKAGKNNSRGLVQLGEFIGALKFRYYEQGKGIVVYPSTSIKKFATSDGGADKLKMCAYLKNDYHQYYHPYFDNIQKWENPTSDMVDSFWICEALRCHIKHDVLGSDALTAKELMGVQQHTAKSESISEMKMIRKPQLYHSL